MFNKPNPKQDFYQLESQILEWWKSEKILNKSIEQRPEENSRTFYDGPITANGEAHTGHMLTFSIKDIIPRYWSMKGYRVQRSLGWDCHGIPVEYEVEKKLGFKEKKDIEKYGIAAFNQLCKESVMKYRQNIIELEEKVGRMTNSDEEYATMDTKFIESVWWSLKELYNKGMLYEGFKVVPYSTRAGTTLSNAEVALGGYKPFVDPAITVEFKLKEDPTTMLLAWTTTPWTIPTNLGLAVGKEVRYAKVSIEGTDKKYIVAKDLVEKVFKDKTYKIESEVTANDLVGKEYIPPFDFFAGRENAHKVYEGFHVTTDSGSGIVHLAPYGAEDNEIFQKVGIESFDVLDEQGDFNEMIKQYAGLNYRDANPKIIEDLKSNDKLFSHEDYEHEMPMCWRTKTPLIYKPITSWFVAMSKVRKELVDNNNKVNWIPAHAKDGRFGNWLAEIKDWGISRKRYWGTPLPVWKSESGKVMLIGSFEELEKLSGVKIDDPHRPFIDEVTFEVDGEKYTRITDVIDVWYDSGAMPFARLHYPFENQDKFPKKFPAQFIAEGIDQTRGWFYTLHALGTTLFNRNAFENVVINGTIVDAQKRKLSKSLGNYTPPLPTIEEFGADTIRMNFFSTPLMYGEDTTVDKKTLKETKQEYILPLWNIYAYLTTYANIHNWKPSEELALNQRKFYGDEHPWDHIPFDNMANEMDSWMILELQKTILEVTEAMDNFKIPKAAKAISKLIDNTSRWYIRSSRDRFVSGDQSALNVLYYTFVEILKLLSPFAPFVTEHIYKEIVAGHIINTPESIHLTDYPVADQKFISEYATLSEEMDIVRRICEMGHELRVSNQLKVRQPLRSLEVQITNEKMPGLAEWMKELIANELNVMDVMDVMVFKEGEFIKMAEDTTLNLKVGLNTEIDQELKKMGLTRDFTRSIQALRKEIHLQPTDKIILKIEKNETADSLYGSVEEIKQIINASSIEIVEKLENGENISEIEIDNAKIRIKIEKNNE